MTAPERPVQSSEVSFKYMAWSIKEIAASMKEISATLAVIKDSIGKRSTSQPCQKPTVESAPHNDDIPF